MVWPRMWNIHALSDMCVPIELMSLYSYPLLPSYVPLVSVLRSSSLAYVCLWAITTWDLVQSKLL